MAWYIWLNPVRKGYCKQPQEYPYSGSFTEAGKSLFAAWPRGNWSPAWRGGRAALKRVRAGLKPEPDFVAVDAGGVHWLLETKGQETVDVLRKDAAAIRWCENATQLSGKEWRYLKVPQKDYEALRPTRLADLAALQPAPL